MNKFMQESANRNRRSSFKCVSFFVFQISAWLIRADLLRFDDKRQMFYSEYDMSQRASIFQHWSDHCCVETELLDTRFSNDLQER